MPPGMSEPEGMKGMTQATTSLMIPCSCWAGGP